MPSNNLPILTSDGRNLPPNGATMTNPHLQLPDPLSDNAGIIIKALQDSTTWGNEQRGLLKQLIDMLGRKRYITFAGHPQRYRLTQIGQSCLMDVPANKRGHLSAFRGKRIRLVCVSSGRLDRQLMAGVLQ
jgi:hypothetical protein